MNTHSMKCWLWKVLWAVSALSLVGAWASVVMGAPLFNIDPGLLLWNAVILASLAISIKLDCASCSACSVPRA